MYVSAYTKPVARHDLTKLQYMLCNFSFKLVLYSDEDKEMLEAGVSTMLQIAAKLLSKKEEDPETPGQEGRGSGEATAG